MSFWEFLWMIIKAGLFVYFGIPLILLILLIIFL